MIRATALVSRPSWACTVPQEDVCGVYVDRDFDGIIQRFRFMPTGIFFYGDPGPHIPRGAIVSGGGGWRGNRTKEFIRSPFWLADTPVTQSLWERMGNENHSQWKNPDHPISSVSFQDATKFAEKLDCRLPNECMWEYAAYGADRPEEWYTDEKMVLENFAWTDANSGGSIRPVRRRWSNPCGLFDMLGNVAEWCRPYQRADYCSDRLEESLNFVLRGGCFGWRSVNLRPWARWTVATREASSTGEAASFSGFRLCCPHIEY